MFHILQYLVCKLFPISKDKSFDTLIHAFIGDKATRRHDAARSLDLSTVLYVKTIHINSAILAAKSPFFYKVNVVNLPYAASNISSLLHFAF